MIPEVNPLPAAAVTFKVKTMTVMCPCGCQVLTAIPFNGVVYAHLWPDQIRLSLGSRWLTRVNGWICKLRPIKGWLVLLESVDGKRVQCAPAKLTVGYYGEICTPRSWEWRELC